MRSISRVADVSINTVSKLLVDAGKACAAFHDDKVRGVKARRVQVDEIWSFTAAKQKNVPAMKAPVEGAGDTWTWTAIEADTKLLITWLVGGRDSEHAHGVHGRLAGPAGQPRAAHQRRPQGLPGGRRRRVRRRYRLRHAGEALRCDFGERQGPLQPRRVHRRSQGADRGQPRPGARRARPMPNGRTSRCGCRCAALLGSPMRSRRNSRTTCTWSRSIPSGTTS